MVPFKEKLEKLISIPEFSNLNDSENKILLKTKKLNSCVSDGEYVENLISKKK